MNTNATFRYPVALTIAGSDSGGGAGIQADLKTFSALGVFGASAITSITAQNTQGVKGIQAISPEIVEGQIHAVFEDLTVDAVKIGMLHAGKESGFVDIGGDQRDAVKKFSHDDFDGFIFYQLAAACGDHNRIENDF